MTAVAGACIPPALVDLAESIKCLPDSEERERTMCVCAQLESHFVEARAATFAAALRNPHPTAASKEACLKRYASTLGMLLNAEARRAARLIEAYYADVCGADDGDTAAAAGGDRMFDPVLDALEDKAPLLMQTFAKLAGAVTPGSPHGTFPDRLDPAAMGKYRRAVVNFANIRRVKSQQGMANHARFWTTVWSAAGAKPTLKGAWRHSAS